MRFEVLNEIGRQKTGLLKAVHNACRRILGCDQTVATTDLVGPEDHLKMRIEPELPPDYLEKIGIDNNLETVGDGYIKLLWSDFIVEEITSSNKIISIDAAEEEQLNEENSHSKKKRRD